MHKSSNVQRPVTRNFHVYFDLRPNKRLSKQLRGWWFETQSRPLWRHRNIKKFSMKHAKSKMTVSSKVVDLVPESDSELQLAGASHLQSIPK